MVTAINTLSDFQLVSTRSGVYESLFIYLVVGSAAFSSTMLFPGVSLADAFFLCLSIFCLLYALNAGSINMPRWSFYVVLLLVCGLVGGVVVKMVSDFTFSDLEFIKSFTKLCFYGFGSLFLVIYVARIDTACVGKAIINILTFNAVIAIYIYIAMQIPIGMPYELFWIGQQGPVTAGFFGGVESGFVRARGVFSEPSNLGIFQVMGLAFLYFKSQIINKFSWKYLIILISILLTFSMTGYFLLSVAMLVFYRQNIKSYILPVIVILAIVIFFSPLRDVFQETIIERIYRVFQGLDRSGNARLLASWELPLKVISISPFFGAGLGNLESAYTAFSYDLAYGDLIMKNPQGWNILAYVLGTMGLVGFFTFIIFIMRLIVRNPSAGVIFLLFLFTSGRFLEPLLWIYYVLYSKPNISIHGNTK